MARNPGEAGMDHQQRETLRVSVQKKYKAVAGVPQGHFPYPVGRESAVRLGYDRRWIEGVPPQVVEHFVGVGNPLSVCMPQSGDDVLDVGCGSGFDTYVAWLKGATSTGIDPTAEMLPPAPGTVGFLVARAEELPFEDASFDMVISNGALNLVPDKDRAYREIFRVLRVGGTLAVADLLVIETIPDEVLADVDAWST